MKLSIGILSRNRNGGKALRRLHSALEDIEQAFTQVNLKKCPYEGIVLSFRDPEYGSANPYTKKGYYHIGLVFNEPQPTFLPNDDKHLLELICLNLRQILPDLFSDPSDQLTVEQLIAKWEAKQGSV